MPSQITKPVALDETLQDLVAKTQLVADKLTPVIDSSLSPTSTNPVQNKVVTAAISALNATGITVENGMIAVTYDE